VRAAVASNSEVFAGNRAVGRIGLAVRATPAATRRERVIEDGSLRVRFPGPPSPELEAVIVNAAGGIAGGDKFDVDMDVGEDASLVVTSASAEKVYRSLGPDATIRVRLAVGAKARLAWLPQETILFDRARLMRTIEVELAETASLLLAEAIVFGRSGMGEQVRQGHFFDRWRICRGDRLIYAETVRLDGEIAQKLAQPAVASGGCAVATILLVPGNDEKVAAVRALGDRFAGEVAISAWNGICVARLCARDGAALRRDLVDVLTVLRGGALPRLWS
jgi:urease accessory protein